MTEGNYLCAKVNSGVLECAYDVSGILFLNFSGYASITKVIIVKLLKNHNID